MMFDADSKKKAAVEHHTQEQQTSLSGIRVGIDGSNLALEKGTGVATYARTLSYSLRDMGALIDIVYGYRVRSAKNSLIREMNFFDVGGIKPTWHNYVSEYIAASFRQTAMEVPITGTVVARTFEARLPRFDRIMNAFSLFNISREHFRRHGKFMTLRMKDPPEIMHWTYPLPIRLLGAKNIYTIHDLVPIRLPYTTLDNKKYYYRLVKKCLETGDHICTVSNKSKSDILDIFNVNPDKISNTYQSVMIPEEYLQKTDDEVAREIQGIFGIEHKRYFLFFGSIEPKKNVGRLIEGFLSSRAKDPLIIVGAQAWKSEQELKLYNEYEARFEKSGGGTGERRIIKFGYAPFSLLTSLIRGAKAVLFPSLYEGFGLPVLEAMLMGTPVLSSQESSIPEIAGDAALLIDPYNMRELADGIERLDTDPALRQELSKRGEIQAKRFGMDQYRERLDTMYRKVLQ